MESDPLLDDAFNAGITALKGNNTLQERLARSAEQRKREEAVVTLLRVVLGSVCVLLALGSVGAFLLFDKDPGIQFGVGITCAIFSALSLLAAFRVRKWM